MIIKHSSDETPKPNPVSLRLARVVSIGNGTVDVCPIGSSVVLHDIPVTSSTSMQAGDVINLQMIDNRRFAFAQQNVVETPQATESTITISTESSGGGGGAVGTLTSGSGISQSPSGSASFSGNINLSLDSTVARNTWPVNAGNGLTGGGNLSSSGVALNVDPGDGVQIALDKVAVDGTVARNTWLINAGNGLTITNGGALSPSSTTINVGAGLGISVGNDSVSINLASPYSGLSIDNGLEIRDDIAGSGLGIANKILSVNTGNGLEINSDSVGIKLASPSGLTSDASGLYLSDSVAGDGLQIGSKVLSVKNSDTTINVASAGIKVNQGYGYTWTASHTWANAQSISSVSAMSGFAGNGWMIKHDGTSGNIDVDNLSVRGVLRVYELLIQQIRATNGSIYVTSAGKAASVTGSGPYTIVFEGKTGDIAPFAVNDLIRAQRVALGSSTLVWRSDLTVTAINVSGNALAITASLRSGSNAPEPGMEYVRIGNTSSTSRQGSIYLTSDDSFSPYIDIVSGIAAFTDWGTAGKIRSRIGRLDGISFASAFANEYGIWSGTGTGVNDQYVRVSDKKVELRNVPLELFGPSGTDPQVRITAGASNNSPSLAMGLTLPTASLSNGTGVWMGLESGSYRFRIGTVASGNLTAGILWNGSALTVTGAINVVAGGNAATTSDVSTAQTTAISTAASDATTKANNAVTTAGTNADTKINAIVSQTTGRLAFSLPAAPTAGAGLYLGSNYLGYYNGGWKTYMDNTGDFYLSGAGNNGLSWDGTNLDIDGDITARNGSIAGVLSIGASGGIYQGSSGSFASPGTGLKIWTENSAGRIAGYNNGTAQWYAGTDGRLYAGGGNIRLASDGIVIPSATGATGDPFVDVGASAIRFASTISGTAYGLIYGQNNDVATRSMTQYVEAAGGAVWVTLTSGSPNAIYSRVNNGSGIEWTYTNLGPSSFVVERRSAVSGSLGKITLESGSGAFTGGLNVGSATEAATGEIKASASGTFMGGLNVGVSTSAGTGKIKAEINSTETSENLEVQKTQIIRYKYGPFGFDAPFSQPYLQYDITSASTGRNYGSFFITFSARENGDNFTAETWHFQVYRHQSTGYVWSSQRISGTARVTARQINNNSTTGRLTVGWWIGGTSSGYNDGLEVTVTELAAGLGAGHLGTFSMQSGSTTGPGYTSPTTAQQGNMFAGNIVATDKVDASNGYVLPTSNNATLFGMDASAEATSTVLANGAAAFYPFTNANNFSGMLMITNTTNRSVGLFIVGGGTIALVSDSDGGTYTTSSGTANRINVYISGSAVAINNRNTTDRSVRVVGIRMNTAI